MGDEFELALRSAVRILHDGHLGFAEVAHHMKDPEVKGFLLRESLIREQFAGELEAELTRHGLGDVRDGGTAAGKVQRAWAELKARLGGGDDTLLATALEREEDALSAYDRAIQDNRVPLPVKQILVDQQQHILKMRETLEELRAKYAA